MWAFKWCIYHYKVDNLVEDLAEMAHLILHDVLICIKTVETEYAQLAFKFLVKTLVTCTFRQVET